MDLNSQQFRKEFYHPKTRFKGFVPIPATPILGREKEIAELTSLFKHHKVVSVTGTGGIGKTRIAIELCNRIGKEIPDNIIFVSMATLTEATEVMPALADILGIAETADRPLAIGVSEVLSYQQSFLVIDNLEHVISAGGEISKLIARCPDLKILCTSRTPLKINAEYEYSLHPLPLPTEAELEFLIEYPVIELFVNCAKKVNRAFKLSPENSTTILEICQYLDGLPLAIELAASRLRVLTPQQLIKRLKNNIDILATSAKDRPERHQTLRKTIEWSYNLLSDSEKRLFRRLSIFSKGFSLEATEEICYGNEVDSLDPINEIESLVDKGLVQKLDSDGRFTLLQTIKDYAAEKCEALEIDIISRKHAQFYFRVTGLISEATQGKNQKEQMNLALLDEPNIVNALNYLLALARENDEDARELGFRMCGNLWTFWHIHGKHVTTKEYVNSFFDASKKDAPTVGKCASLFSLHVACYTLGEIELSRNVAERLLRGAVALDNKYEMIKGFFALGFGNMFSDLNKSISYNNRAIQLCEEIKTTYWLGLSLWQSGIFNLISGNYDAAESGYSGSLAIFKRLNENEGIGIAQSGLCMLEFIAGNYTRALELYSDTLLAFKAIGDRPEEARVYSEISWTYLAIGDTHSALSYALASIKLHQEIGSNRGIGLSLNSFAAIEAVKGRSKKAVEIAAAAKHFADQKGVAIELGVNNHGEIYLENAKKKLTRSEIKEAENKGIRLTLQDILEMVKGTEQMKPHEDDFVQKLKNAIEENLSDSTFDVNRLNNAVSMSQMQVYRKLKALINKTPSQFIRNYRLQKAQELLKTSDKTIAEIAYEVGFTDPNYFSRAFTKLFSQTPTDYRDWVN
ncbi:MAG: helix-turn-helix domain-containing protein [Saprospiraceae bacterium]|nr:helix-turn-helix domain-containing protein [Saprospiraceae bacterium]